MKTGGSTALGQVRASILRMVDRGEHMTTTVKRLVEMVQEECDLSSWEVRVVLGGTRGDWDESLF